MVEEIKGQFTERLKNPLYITFTISWISWNYPFILAILSGMTFNEKISYLNNVLYTSNIDKLFFTLFLPLTTALIIVFSLPYINKHIVLHWKKSNISVEHNEQIYKEELQKEKTEKLEKLLDKEEKISALNNQLIHNNHRANELNIQNQSLRSAIKEREKIIKSLSKRLNDLSESSIRIEDVFDHIAGILSNIKIWGKIGFPEYEELISDTGKHAKFVRSFIDSMSLVNITDTEEGAVIISEKGTKWLDSMMGKQNGT